MIYEYINEISYPHLPSLSISLFHAFSYSIIFVLTITSDDFNRAFSNNKVENLYNDIFQLVSIMYLTFATQYFMRSDIQLKRLEADKQEQENINDN
jgi:hypothetical protein